MAAEIRSLTGVRGLAACWVMVGHYLGDTPSNATVRFFVYHSYVAVDAFLILSGFVLARTYQARLREPFAATQFAHFLCHRIARIYPLYALVTVVCALMVLSGVQMWGDPELSIGLVAGNLLMLQSWGPPATSLDAAAWSISTEWAANLLFPAFVVLLLRWPIRRSALIAGAALLCLADLAFRKGNAGGAMTAVGALNWYTFPQSLIRCVTEFMLGVFCWRLSAEAGWATWLGRTHVLLALLLASAVLTLTTSLDLVLVLLVCGLVVGLSFERSWPGRVLGAPAVRWLGTISFSIYLLHMPLLALRPGMRDLLTRSHMPIPGDGANWILMATVIGVSALSFRFVEKPAQCWLRGAFGRRPQLGHGAAGRLRRLNVTWPFSMKRATAGEPADATATIEPWIGRTSWICRVK